MLKKLTRIFSGEKTTSLRTLDGRDYGIHSERINSHAKSVISRLKHSGFAAYLVGGGVRDLLLNGHPKDFDVATDASPEQIKKLFRNSRIIGRRFQIVHVRYGREIIEVTTFRASHEKARNGQAHQSDRGVLLRDNVFGNIESDAFRRDFTINALYYDSEDDSLLDFTGGLEDLEARRLKLIGHPDNRYKEDPVRMLRAVRFAAKLGFQIDPKTEEPIRAHADYLEEIPPARLFEEVSKLMLSGYSLATLTMLREYDLFQYLFPGASACVEQQIPLAEALFEQTAINTDKRIRQQKRVTPAFFYAAFLWPSLQRAMKPLIEEEKLSEFEAMQRAGAGVIGEQLTRTTIPKRFLIPMREIWSLQARFKKGGVKRHIGYLSTHAFALPMTLSYCASKPANSLTGSAPGGHGFKTRTKSNASRCSMNSDQRSRVDAGQSDAARQNPNQRPTKTASRAHRCHKTNVDK